MANPTKFKRTSLGKQWSLTIILIIIMLALPLVIQDQPYITHLLIIMFIYSIVAVNWNLVMGYAGILSLGQLSFFAIGGYASGLTCIHLGVSPWVGIIIGALAAVVVGLIIGLPVLRLYGIYVAFVTIAFQEAIRLAILNEYDITGGSIGLVGIPPLGFSTPFTKIEYYYVGLIFLVAISFIIYRILKSRVGLAFIAMRDSEIYAAGRGISIYRAKLLIFAISAFFTGVAGGVYAHYFTTMAPYTASLPLLIVFELIIILGGLGKSSGPIIGTLVYIFLTEYLRIIEEWRLVVFPIIVILVIIFLPSGLASVPEFFPRFKGIKLRKPKI